MGPKATLFRTIMSIRSDINGPAIGIGAVELLLLFVFFLDKHYFLHLSHQLHPISVLCIFTTFRQEERSISVSQQLTLLACCVCEGRRSAGLVFQSHTRAGVCVSAHTKLVAYKIYNNIREDQTVQTAACCHTNVTGHLNTLKDYISQKDILYYLTPQAQLVHLYPFRLVTLCTHGDNNNELIVDCH